LDKQLSDEKKKNRNDSWQEKNLLIINKKNFKKKLSLENELKTLNIKEATQNKEIAELSSKAFKYD
jgi:hypothetical protein